MIRFLTTICAALLIAISFGLYMGVLRVKAQQRELSKIEVRIAQEREVIRVLKAEWSFLNQPERLQALAQRHLTLAPTAASQIVPVSSLPVRQDAGLDKSFSAIPSREAATREDVHVVMPNE